MKSRRQELKLPLARKRCVGFTTMETLGREKLVCWIDIITLKIILKL